MQQNNKNINTRNSFWVIDLNLIKEAKRQNSPQFSSILRSKVKEHQDNPDFLVSLIEVVGTQAFYWQLPNSLLEKTDYLKLAVLADSKCLKFIPKEKLQEDILLQVIEGQDKNLENLFIYPHVTEKLTFSLCYLALKKKNELCLMNYFKTEPKIILAKEEKQILYAQLTMLFKSLNQKLPPYLEKYETISSKLTPDTLDSMVKVLQLKNKLQINLPEKLDIEKRVKI